MKESLWIFETLLLAISYLAMRVRLRLDRVAVKVAGDALLYSRNSRVRVIYATILMRPPSPFPFIYTAMGRGEF